MKITICILFILVSSLSYSETFDVYDACIVKHENLILEVREIGSQFISNSDFFEGRALGDIQLLRERLSFCADDLPSYYDSCEDKYFFPGYYFDRVNRFVDFPMGFLDDIYNYYANLGWMKMFYRHDKHKKYYLDSNYESKLDEALDVLTFLEGKKHCLEGNKR